MTLPMSGSLISKTRTTTPKGEIDISKQLTSQRFILKIHSGRLRDSGWDLTLPLAEARANDEIISLGDSQILRWISEIRGRTNADDRIAAIRSEIKDYRRKPVTAQTRRAIKKLYDDLDHIQYVPEYLNVIIDKEKDYYRACHGFILNGIRYVRLLGTSGGVKCSTIVFVADDIASTLRERIANGRKMDAKFVPAKLEAYQALVCSGSTPVSMPHGVAVVKDFETTFKANIIKLGWGEGSEPEMSDPVDEDVTLDGSDGCGMMLPSLAMRWSEDLKLDYLMSGCCIRNAWTKGMIFPFDFLDFADSVAGTRIIKDAWGHDVDLSNVELILTTSMLKLWDCYDSIEHFLSCCEQNHYTFGVTKACPKALENERSTNYQFLQSYDLDDEDIAKLIGPTVDEIHDILGLDPVKTILFLRGVGITDENVDVSDDDFAKALMANQDVINDAYVRKKVYGLIRKRIDDAKIGVIKVHGNYSIVSGDLYGLCESMFGMPVHGLLRAGEIYNGYWADTDAEELACFRAPMSCHENIRKVKPCRRDDVRYWYQYMRTCTVLNAWDLITAALNGMDFDGDLVMLTDNEVLVNRIQDTPVLVCAQNKANKMVPTEDDMIRANINSFGDDIGKITNRITSMFEVRAGYPKDSEEYKVLSYRIRCGQLLQQDRR